MTISRPLNTKGVSGRVVRRPGRPKGLAKNDDALFIFDKLRALGASRQQAENAVEALLGVDGREIRRARVKGIDCVVGMEDLFAAAALARWASLIRDRIASKQIGAMACAQELPAAARAWLLERI
jgi:hypothetical protein